MADETIAIRVKMIGGEAVVTEAKAVSGAVAGTGTTAAKATREQSKFRSGLGALGRTLRYSSIPLLGGLAYETVRSVNAYREARKVGEQTNAVIKSTGGIANATADDISKLANSLSLKTGADDEEIQSAANMLLTFRNIRNEAGRNNDILNQTTAATLDLAAATKTDMISAAKQLGKALQDPRVGLTALRRSGVSFSEQQTDMINRLFESGKRLKAQKMILRELSKEFDGSARSQHDAVDRLGVAWENLEETLGKAVYPILKDVTNWLTRSIRAAEKGKGPIQDIKNVFHAFGDEIQRVSDNLSALKNIFDSITGSTFEDALRDASQVPGVNLTGQPQAPDPIRGGGHRGNNLGNEPGHKAPTANQAHRGGNRTLRIPLVVNGKKIAEAMVDESQIAAAWG